MITIDGSHQNSRMSIVAVTVREESSRRSVRELGELSSSQKCLVRELSIILSFSAMLAVM